MSVINCKVKYLRPQYNDLKQWMEDKNNVYIGRKGVVFINNKRFPEESSNFCNPYKIGIDGTREEVLNKYRRYINIRLQQSKELEEELISLKGKNLGCWCNPEPCHGDILLELINKY
jgi:hypothetical protein